MVTRRQILQLAAAMLALPASELFAESATSKLPLIQKKIPSSGELLPVIGMGTSRTFNKDDDPESMAKLTAVIQAFFAAKGMVIDSSPMYGSAEARVGDVLRSMKNHPKVFAATKVWTRGREQGISDMLESAQRMNVKNFDLISVHNLVDWKTQLDTLKNWKKEGKVRYIGITTSHGRDHDEFIQVMKSEPIDFVQFSYNIANLDAEREILPVARDKGIATMINRPYQRGSLFRQSKGKALPEMAKDIDCTSWGQFYLKFILGHPDITCAIPATSKAKHMVDNMQANFGRLPDQAQRKEMLNYFNSL
ncbi:aldo/keto reductase [Cocleimonas sp. KMM 6892]|uniref:aldo/keto reductase n=1 Tax=unclassified Cocleimonas TaxID=2639732 RepID=UPI002DBF4486|nr:MULTISPECIES: aldo/keto reductase [unclassified Cocleimonas]MEB8433168.1 aldo/keto reductase [Cocleimonas sp. KMM 6892]MEC4715851.1 aldo/keto reductase [Cocleimonas sp. KMM 6895]MEC4745312.1 aldo/keto reductase [Cocleimonas sp. KMM 6896]